MRFLRILPLFVFIILLQVGLLHADTSTSAATEVVTRILPERADEFRFKTIDKDNGNDVFEIISKGDQIVISASSSIAMCSGFNWYLKHVANCHVSWNGDQLNIPDPLPSAEKRIRKVSPYKYGYYFNYCTFNYTMAWWDWR